MAESPTTVVRNSLATGDFNAEIELPFALRIEDFRLAMQDVYDFFFDVNSGLGAWAAETCRAHEVDRLASRRSDLRGCTDRRGDVDPQERPSATLRHSNEVELTHLAALMPLAWHPFGADSAPSTRA